MTSKHVDHLIVGQGLAGSLLSMSLLSRDQTVLVIDNHHSKAASAVAAGLINPITGHRWNLTAEFDNYLAAAKSMYQSLERLTNVKLLTPLKQTKLVKNQGQANFLAKRLSDSKYTKYLSRTSSEQLIDKGFGFVEIDQTYIVDVQALLLTCRNWLQSKGALVAQDVDYTSITIKDSGITYQNFEAKNIFFCEGAQAIKNPWLQHLPFKLSKGSVLDIELSKPKSDLLNWGRWLAPKPGSTSTTGKTSHYKMGSTYQWQDLSENIPWQDRDALMQSFEDNTCLSGQVRDHKTGIRPTTVQRKPFVGPLSAIRKAYVLNGLGSKGCLIAPWHVEALVDHVLHDSVLREDLTQWL